MVQKKVLFRVDANPNIGMGHRMRMQSLYQALKHLMPFKAFHMGEGDFVPEAEKVIPKQLRNLDLDLVVQDVLAPETFSVPCVTIEDFGGHFYSDIVLCGNILKSKADFPNAKIVFCGPEYALLRPEFGYTYSIPPKKYDLTFLIGSGEDAARKSMHYLSLLAIQGNKYQIAFIAGRTFPKMKDLQFLFPHIDYFQELPVETLIQTLLASKLAIISAGMSLYELNALGIPFLSFVSHPNQKPELDRFVALGITKDISILPDSVFCTLIETASVRSYQKIIDGNGALRAAQHIKNSL